MRFYRILLFAFLTNLCLIYQLPAQGSQSNVATVQDIYDAVQNKDTSTPLAELASKIIGHDINMASEAFDRYRITLPAIIKNQWEKIAVIHLQIEEMDGNMVIAKGEFTGRPPTDCEIVTTKFQHVWSIKNGNIIEFKEESIKQKL